MHMVKDTEGERLIARRSPDFIAYRLPAFPVNTDKVLRFPIPPLTVNRGELVSDPIRIEPLAHFRTNVLRNNARAHARQSVRHHVLTQLLLKVTFHTSLKRLKVNTHLRLGAQELDKHLVRTLIHNKHETNVTTYTHGRDRWRNVKMDTFNTPGRPDRDWCILAWTYGVQNSGAFRSNFEPYASFRADSM
jgi:hypothetical protein